MSKRSSGNHLKINLILISFNKRVNDRESVSNTFQLTNVQVLRARLMVRIG